MKPKGKGDKKFIKKVKAARKAAKVNAAKKKAFFDVINVVGEWARRRVQEQDDDLFYLRGCKTM